MTSRWHPKDIGLKPLWSARTRARPYPSGVPEASILVAEDNPPSAELLHDYLESIGYRVELATDGTRAIEMAMTGRFRLLILDVNMPGSDGVQVLQRLRQEMAQPPRVIIVTADRLATRRDELTQAGIDGYMTKPVDLGRLGEEVKRVLAEAGAGRG